MGITLLGPGNVFDKASTFHVLARTGLSGSFWGGVLITDWFMLWTVVIFKNIKPIIIYLVMILSGPFWLALGGALLIGSMTDGSLQFHISGGGLFCLFLGVMSIVSCVEMGGQM